MTLLGKKINTVALKRKTPRFLWSIVRFVLLLGISYVILYPLLVKFSLVFMDQIDLKDVTVKWIPRHFTVDNIVKVVQITDYFTVLLKTVGFCALIAFIQVGVCTLAGCGFARFKFKGRGILFILVIGTLVVPPQTYIVPLYRQFMNFDFFWLVSLFNGGNGINTINSAWPFILLAATGMGIRSGLYIYILRQAFRGLPKELEEAASVDGAGGFRTFFQVLLPNVIPTVLVAFILSFVWQWNDTFYTSLFAPSLGTMSLVVSGLRVNISTYLGGWNQTIGNMYTSMLINTGTLLSMIPVIILFVVCQKFFVQGVERSGLVG